MLLIHNTLAHIVHTNLQVVTNIAGNLSICICLYKAENAIILSIKNTLIETNATKRGAVENNHSCSFIQSIITTLTYLIASLSIF